jgi:TRAP-type uncharacterized transport system fused permease subunit
MRAFEMLIIFVIILIASIALGMFMPATDNLIIYQMPKFEGKK